MCNNLTKEEKMISKLITEEMKKSDILDIIKKDKDFEKRVKEITSDVVKEMFRILWQHNNIFKSLAN